uniref:Disintegrin domain-containing protein n=1 Tax=Lotharella globosa TaxID=91324 RepID=A0A7S3YY77_9EUKA
MSSSVSPTPLYSFTSQSKGYANTFFTTKYGSQLTACMENDSGVDGYKTHTCGNGFVEGNEQCDVGYDQFDSDICCNSDCTLAAGCQCATTEPCCTSTGNFRPSTYVCRNATSTECDIPETCTGSQGTCPTDLFNKTGTVCQDVTKLGVSEAGLCYKGQCKSKSDNCPSSNYPKWKDRGGNNICTDTLWCSTLSGWSYSSAGAGAASGTPCGTNMQCRASSDSGNGTCVPSTDIRFYHFACTSQGKTCRDEEGKWVNINLCDDPSFTCPGTNAPTVKVPTSSPATGSPATQTPTTSPTVTGSPTPAVPTMQPVDPTPAPTPAPTSPPTPGTVGLTQAEIDAFLDLHNEDRRTVSPDAANMMKMVWNDAIAQKAKEVADKLVFEHSSQSFRTFDNGVFNGYHGENIAAGQQTPAAVMQGWVESERYSQNQDYSRSNGGHMTQCLWHNSYLLGCAKALGLPTYNTFWVCIYGYGGNFGSSLVYTQGTPCSQCPTGFTTCENKLCVLTSSPTSPTPQPTLAQTPQPTPNLTPQPTPLVITPYPTPEPTSDPTPQPTPDPTPQPTPNPTPEPTPDPTPDPTPPPIPGQTPQPTPIPSAYPTPQPTLVPTPYPTPQPTPDPTLNPTPQPTPDPTPNPTPQPTPDPTPDPTPPPVPGQTPQPTPIPSAYPTPQPTTADPTPAPTLDPTPEPTHLPTDQPTLDPTHLPTDQPTLEPTPRPVEPPTPLPTLAPIDAPTRYPTPELVEVIEIKATFTNVDYRTWNPQEQAEFETEYKNSIAQTTDVPVDAVHILGYSVGSTVVNSQIRTTNTTMAQTVAQQVQAAPQSIFTASSGFNTSRYGAPAVVATFVPATFGPTTAYVPPTSSPPTSVASEGGGGGGGGGAGVALIGAIVGGIFGVAIGIGLYRYCCTGPKSQPAEHGLVGESRAVPVNASVAQSNTNGFRSVNVTSGFLGSGRASVVGSIAMSPRSPGTPGSPYGVSTPVAQPSRPVVQGSFAEVAISGASPSSRNPRASVAAQQAPVIQGEILETKDVEAPMRV